MVLYRSYECIGYAELEQSWKSMTIMLYKLSPMQKHYETNLTCHKKGHVNPVSSFEQIW